MRVYTRVENVDVEVADAAALLAHLKTCNHGDNAAIVRIDGDAGYFDLILAINKQIQYAGNGSALSGGAVDVWTVAATFADGGGWRFVLGAAQVNAQRPQIPPPSPRLVRG